MTTTLSHLIVLAVKDEMHLRIHYQKGDLRAILSEGRRPVVLGRRKCLSVSFVADAKVSIIARILIETAKRNNMEPHC